MVVLDANSSLQLGLPATAETLRSCVLTSCCSPVVAEHTRQAAFLIRLTRSSTTMAGGEGAADPSDNTQELAELFDATLKFTSVLKKQGVSQTTLTVSLPYFAFVSRRDP